MTDIVERLRNHNIPYGWLELAGKAAAEIERLRDDETGYIDEIKRLRADNAAMLAALKTLVDNIDWRNARAGQINADARAAIARAESRDV